jgi:hypothetical protein
VSTRLPTIAQHTLMEGQSLIQRDHERGKFVAGCEIVMFGSLILNWMSFRKL